MSETSKIACRRQYLTYAYAARWVRANRPDIWQAIVEEAHRECPKPVRAPQVGKLPKRLEKLT